MLAWIRRAAPQCLVFHVPNGGLRNRFTAARLKGLGTLAGVSDLIVLATEGAFFIEIKPPKGGTLSPEQKAFRDAVRALGFKWAMARSIDDARAAFAAWGIPTREKAIAA